MAVDMPAGAALVLVDLQVRIVELSTAPHAGAEVVERAAALAAACRAAGRPVVLVRTHRLDERGRRLVLDGDELAPALAPGPDDVVVTKHSWGAFADTGLDSALRRRGVRHLVLGGIATNFGVESTARAADDLGYGVTLVEDAASGLDAEEHRFAVAHIWPRLGTVTTTAALLTVRGRGATGNPSGD
jgi:nicotinamidase-related amidase